MCVCVPLTNVGVKVILTSRNELESLLLVLCTAAGKKQGLLAITVPAGLREFCAKKAQKINS